MVRLICALFAVALSAAACASPGPGDATAPDPTASAPEASPGDDLPEAPDFTLETFGQGTFRLSESRGTPVVLNFWASWCPQCRSEQPHINDVARAFSDDVLFFGVAWKSTTQDSLDYIDEFGVPYASGLDTSEDVFRSYGVNYQPATVFVTHDGKILRRHAGVIAQGDLEEGVGELLALL